MLFDLIRALLAAFVVTIAPGWFWAGLLRAQADHAERVVYSVALSMALVPVVALVPAYLLGTGVTLALALISPPVVFFSGLAAYLRFGPAKGSGEPLLPFPVPPLGTPALALLIPALGLAAGVVIGAIPGEPVDPPITGGVAPGPRTLILICALVVAAGLLQVFLSRRAQAQGTTEPPDETAAAPTLSFPPSWRRLSLLAVLALVLARGYLGPVLHEWPFIRGVDHYSHAVMANRMMTEGKIEPYLIYPPGFHTMTAMISRLSGLEPLEVFPVLGPTLLLLPAFALYALARRLWGFEYGLAAALLTVLLGGSYYYFNDAMYPNLVATQFLMVLALSALAGLYASPSLRGGLLLALLGSSVVLYHQVASLYLALLLALVGAFFVPYLLFLRDRRRGVALLFALAALGSLSVVYAWDTYDLGGALAGLVGASGSSTTGDAVGMAVGTQPPYGMGLLIGTMVSQPVAWLGLLGFLLLVGGAWRGGGLPVALAHATLLLWALTLFAGSRTSLTGFPQRFGRDLGVPLALLAALALVTLLRSLAPNRRAVVFATSAAVLLTVSLVGVQAAQSLRWASAPSMQVTTTAEISAAGEWLEDHNTGGNIIVSPHINQVPSRMMLAMGHYSALQSFELWQVENPRDLPPTGPGPLLDVIWVVTHPEDERTESILRERDVRYIVLYKNMPDRPTVDFWRLFEAHPDLYRTAFENRDVLIVEPREQAKGSVPAAPSRRSARV